nr:hemoglobin subunit zeta-like [Bubalus bubalis]
MSLTRTERTIIVSLWSKISTQADLIGTKTLERLFSCYPQAKTYFPHFDLHTGSAQLRAHGSKVVAAVGVAVKSIDNVTSALSKLSELHAYVLRVDPVNFKVGAGPRARVSGPGSRGLEEVSFLSHCLLVTLASHFPADFTADAHAAWDKFLSIVSGVLTEKYR